MTINKHKYNSYELSAIHCNILSIQISTNILYKISNKSPTEYSCMIAVLNNIKFLQECIHTIGLKMCSRFVT